MGAFSSGQQLGQRQREASRVVPFTGRFVGEEPPLSAAELDALRDVPPFGHPHHGNSPAFGRRDPVIRSAACFTWGLAGAPEHEQMVRPNDLFNLMAPYTASLTVPQYMDTLGSADPLTQEWVRANADAIQKIRAMPDGSHEQVHAKVRAAAVMLIRAHGMTPDPGRPTPYAVALYYEPQAPPVANWTHWAVEISGQALETNPGVGIWKNNVGFARYWENWVVPLDQHPRRCHTIPVDGLTDGHLRRIRQMLPG